MGIMPFTPMGNTVAFTAAVSAPTPVRAVSTTIGATQYRVHNAGSVRIYLGFGSTAAAATTLASNVLPGPTITMVPNSVEIFTLNANQYFTAVTDSGTSDVFITPGDGA